MLYRLHLLLIVPLLVLGSSAVHGSIGESTTRIMNEAASLQALGEQLEQELSATRTRVTALESEVTRLKQQIEELTDADSPDEDPTDPADPAPSPTDALVPGSGFSSATPQPARIGSSTAQAIVRFDVVPFQDVTEPMQVGVLAFHVNGIDRVEFSLQGGPWKAVASPSANPRTGVTEYHATVDPAGLSGPIELRAVAYPKDGVPRVLESLWLYARPTSTPVVYCSPSGNDSTGNGSQNTPLRTPRRAAHVLADRYGSADGGLIYLLPGEYSIGNASTIVPHRRQRWLTVTAVPGIAKDKVILTQGGSMASSLIRFRRLTVRAPEGFAFFDASTGATPKHSIWLDDCLLIGPGRGLEEWAHPTKFGARYGTNVELMNSANGFHNAELLRGVRYSNIIADAFQNTKLLVNATVSKIGDPLGKAHSDVYQLVGERSNMIVFGLTAVDQIGAQGFFADSQTKLTDVAIVNTTLTNNAASDSGDGRAVWQTGAAIRHMLVQGGQYTGPVRWRWDNGLSVSDLEIVSTNLPEP